MDSDNCDEKELLNDFIVESLENISHAESSLLELEQDTDQDRKAHV
jgi:chemotaxis protein histidine kinase CheA